MNKFFLTYLIFSLSLFGCAQMSSKRIEMFPVPKKEMGLLYILRPHTSYSSAYGAKVSIDGKPTANIASGAFTYLYLSPGEHEFTNPTAFGSEMKGSQQSFTIKAGETMYLSRRLGMKEVGPTSVMVGVAGSSVPMVLNSAGGRILAPVEWAFVTKAEAMQVISKRKYNAAK